MSVESIAPKPPIARQHCRHYSYERGRTFFDGGPQCAVGVNLSGPGASRCCWPNPEIECAKREEWTVEERATWEAWQEAGKARLIAAIAALPPLNANECVTVTCPNCQGQLRYDRTQRRAYVRCATAHCVQFEANLGDGSGPWPASKVHESESQPS